MKNSFAIFFILLFITSKAQIGITVKNSSNYAQTNNPVTLGIPMVEGNLFSLNDLEILSNNNSPTPAQFSIMARWGDGSIKWIKTHFQASVNANSSAEYQLLLNGTNLSPQGITTTETNGEIEVNTGPLKFTINKNIYNLLETAFLDINNNGVFEDNEQMLNSSNTTGFVAINNQLNNYNAQNNSPDAIYIEEQGPLVTVIKIEGKHYNTTGADYFLKYETRIYAYANKPFIKIRHSYANGKSVETLGDSANPAFGEEVEEYTLNFNFDMPGSKNVEVGGNSGTVSAIIDGNNDFSIRQEDRPLTSVPFNYSVENNGNTLSTGAKAAGWMGLTGQNFGVLLSGKYFWEKYPKAIYADGSNNLKYKFIPNNTDEFLWAGQGNGDDLLLYFYPNNEADLSAERTDILSKNPLFAIVDPAYFTSTNVFYRLVDCSSSLPNFNTYLNNITNNHLANRDALDLYGNLHFGDVPKEQWGTAENLDFSEWGNNYYDGILTNAKLFALTGDKAHLDIMEPMVLHWMETACWNTYDENDWMNGFCPAYSANHRDIAHYQHHYGEGVWYYYYLTGDERAREIGMRAANSIKDQQIWGANNVWLRESYQRGSACLEAYKYTRDVSYLNYTKRVVADLIMPYQNEYGLIGSFDNENSLINGEQTFMMALYADVLWKYIKESGDNSLIPNLTALADFVNEHARISPNEEAYYNFWDSPDVAGAPSPVLWGNSDDYVYWNGLSMIAGLYAYAYDLSGNILYQNLANNTLNVVWGNQFGNSFGEEFYGKAAGEALKHVHHTLAILENCGTVGVDNKNLKVDISFFPNPASDNITLKISSDFLNKTFTIIDILGQKVHEQLINSTAIEIDISHFQQGFYFVKLNNIHVSSFTVIR